MIGGVRRAAHCSLRRLAPSALRISKPARRSADCLPDRLGAVQPAFRNRIPRPCHGCHERGPQGARCKGVSPRSSSFRLRLRATAVRPGGSHAFLTAAAATQAWRPRSQREAAARCHRSSTAPVGVGPVRRAESNRPQIARPVIDVLDIPFPCDRVQTGHLAGGAPAWHRTGDEPQRTGRSGRCGF